MNVQHRIHFRTTFHYAVATAHALSPSPLLLYHLLLHLLHLLMRVRVRVRVKEGWHQGSVSAKRDGWEVPAQR